ncbi:MAG TPA: hypothetical protein VGN60_00935 [Devosia sp.]|jgi:hypothetical protein|nr:hypothetical protein [Devosia sp.]
MPQPHPVFNEPTVAEVRRGLRTAALLVKTYGDAYLPFFEQLETELQVAIKREALLDRVNAVLVDQ